MTEDDACIQVGSGRILFPIAERMVQPQASGWIREACFLSDAA